jgi:DNA-binding transcriptional LysR family regulator
VDPKSRSKTHALANVVDGIYRRINDSATSERILSNAGVIPKVVQTAGEMPTLISLVDAGVGVSIVPASVAKRIVSKVAVCSIADRMPESEIKLAFAGQNTAAVVRRFCEYSSQKIMETRSVLPRIHDKWIPFEFAQTNLFLGESECHEGKIAINGSL